MYNVVQICQDCFFLPWHSPFKKDIVITYMGQIMLNTDLEDTFLD